MLKFFRRKKAEPPAPKRIRDHQLGPSILDASALKVIEVLNASGFQAYLVGGCVRDALCGVKPKDFDVATDAPLEAVSKLFRRSRIVGRRFPIVHVRLGRDLIEVSTFRQSISDKVVHDDRGMILRDSAFGTLQEDAFRRDFTVNALYYDPSSREIIDFVGGVDDIKAKKIRFIGDTKTRLAEDPVRILRAVRFSAKLGFSISADIMSSVKTAAKRLEAIPPARLFDEFLKLFLSGYAETVWRQLRETPLANALFPSCAPSSPLILAAMRNTDDRSNGASITPDFWSPSYFGTTLRRVTMRKVRRRRPAFAAQKASNHPLPPRRFGTFARKLDHSGTLHKRNVRSLDRLVTHSGSGQAMIFSACKRSPMSPCVRVNGGLTFKMR